MQVGSMVQSVSSPDLKGGIVTRVAGDMVWVKYPEGFSSVYFWDDLLVIETGVSAEAEWIMALIQRREAILKSGVRLNTNLGIDATLRRRANALIWG